jgi:hypothetical protein
VQSSGNSGSSSISFSEYVKSGQWKQDANPLANFRLALKQGVVLRVYMAFVLLTSLSNASGSVTVQYLLFRFGLGSKELGVLVFVAVLAAAPLLCCMKALVQCCGQMRLAMYAQVVTAVGGAVFWVANPVPLFIFVWAAIVGSTVVGGILISTFSQRLVSYHQQATVAAAISSLQSLSSAIVRIPITAAYAYGLHHTNLTDYTRDTACDRNSNTRKAAMAEMNISVTNTTELLAHFNCPKAPPLREAQGGVCDILTLPLIVAGGLGIASFCTFCYFAHLKPLDEMDRRNNEEVAAWKSQGGTSTDSNKDTKDAHFLKRMPKAGEGGAGLTTASV